MDKKTVIQFEVWNECNNHCAFCSNRYIQQYSDQNKLKMLDVVAAKLSDNNLYRNYNTIAFIGGEFFQGQLRNFEVRSKFFDILQEVSMHLDNNTLKNFWITATLTSENQDDLMSMLNIMKHHEKIWICTSYDTVGRFHSDANFKAWNDNIKYIKKHYPKTNINVTSILTGAFIDEYLLGKFNIKHFCNEHQCTWYSKPPMIPQNFNGSKEEFNNKVLQNFFPSRNKFLQFLMKFKGIESEFDYDKLFNMELRSDSFVRANGEMLSITDRQKDESVEVVRNSNANEFISSKYQTNTATDMNSNKCKHNSGYAPYVDSDACFFCDKEMIKNL